jgi:hypothetical protein
VVAEPRKQLVLKLDPEVGQVFADPMPLRQVISNLLSNACKFTKDGRIPLGIPLSKKIDDPVGPRVRVSVSDSGIGMSSEEAGDDERHGRGLQHPRRGHDLHRGPARGDGPPQREPLRGLRLSRLAGRRW